jgi:hypothetical protein
MCTFIIIINGLILYVPEIILFTIRKLYGVNIFFFQRDIVGVTVLSMISLVK